MNKYIDTTSTSEHNLVWVKLDNYPEHYYAIAESGDTSTLMVADEEFNGGPIGCEISDSERETLAAVILQTFSQYKIAESFVELHAPGKFAIEWHGGFNAIFQKLFGDAYGELRPTENVDEYEIDICASDSKTGIPVLFTFDYDAG